MHAVQTPHKALLRRHVAKLLSGLSPATIHHQSEVVCSQLLNSSFWRSSKCVAVYLSMPMEISTAKIIEAAFQPDSGKKVFVPRIFPADGIIRMLRVYSLEELASFDRNNKYKIAEPPNDPEREDALVSGHLDLVVAPGMAFDTHGGRLGHGKGYYDKFIAEATRRLGKRPAIVGLALSEQMFDSIPMTENDQRIDGVFYPLATLQCTEQITGL